MNRQSFKYSIEEIEKRFNKPIVPDKDLRQRLLNAAFAKIEGCSNAALLRACDSLMMKTYIPSPDELIEEVLKENERDAARADNQQVQKAKQHERDHHSPKNDQEREHAHEALKLVSDALAGRITRKQFLGTMMDFDKKYPGNGWAKVANFGAYTVMCHNQGLDMDKKIGEGRFQRYSPKPKPVIDTPDTKDELPPF